MQEVTRKILAYQRGPFVFVCANAGSIPDQFLSQISKHEKQYVRSRTHSPLLPVVEELLSVVGAAGLSPNVSNLLVDSLREPICVYDCIDSVFIPLCADESTQNWLIDSYGKQFRKDVSSVVRKTKQRFGHAHLVVFSLLPRFIDKKMVSDEFVCFGEQVLDCAAESPLYASELVNPRVLSSLSEHWSFIGVHPKFFSSDSLQKQLVDTLSRLKVSVVAQ